jgi:uncharacterized membrane protein
MAASAPDPFPSAREPLANIAAVALGGALFALGPRNRTGTLVRLAGLALIGVAARPLVREQIRRAGARRRAFSAHSSIDIARPVTEVFKFFKDFENFPRVVGAIRTVADYEDGRSHWEIYSPSGSTLEFDAVVTKYVPNSVIAWKSVTGGPIDFAVLVRFTPLAASSMRLDIDVSYRPIYTAMSDAVRALLAPGAGKRLRNGLEHARFYLESLPAAAEREPSPA